MPAEDDLVAVLEEAVAAEELDHRAFGTGLGAGDRPRGHQVARPQRSAVGSRVRELLRQRPVERPRVAARQRLAVQLHLERDVEPPVAAAREMRQRRRLLRRRLHPRLLQ